MIRTIRMHQPSVALVFQGDLQDFPDFTSVGFQKDRRDRFDPSGEIAVHPIGGSYVEGSFDGV